MEDNVGTIVIGTKVNNKGLKSDLKETEQIVKNFDDNNEISPQVKVDAEKLDKETEKALKKIDKRIENKELKISYDGGGKAFVAGEIWEEYEAGNEELYQQWYNAQHTKEQLKEIEQITAEINAKTNDQLKDEAIKRGEYYKQLEILEEQKQAQQDLARYNETKERLTKQYEVPDLQFDVGIDESQFDATLNEMKFKAEDILHDISKAISRRDEIIENIAGIEKEIAVYEREHELILDDALEFQRLNELKAQGVKLSESENNTLEGLQRRASTLNIIATEYNNLINAQVKAQEKLEEQAYETDKLVRKFGILVQKGKEYSEQMGKSDTDKISKSVDNLGKKFSGLVKKVGGLALALIGIRTIMNLITRSFNTLSQYNTELGTKVEQMRLALAVALEPIINWILTLLQQVLSVINQIVNALLSIDLFGRASELWSKKMAKNMAGGASSAKEMKKQLAGFDEMNVLNDNETSGGGGGAGSGIEPWMLEDVEIPGWMQWIIDHKNEMLAALAGIATALLLIKLGIDLIKATGIGLIIAGLILLIQDFKAYLDDPSWENFGKIWRDIGIILIGVGLIIGGIPGIIIAVIGAIIAAIGLLIEHWDKVKAWLQGIGKWFTQKGEAFKKEGHLFLGDIFSGVSKTIDDLIYIFEWFASTGKIIFDGIIKFFKTTFKDGWKSGLDVLKDTFKQVMGKIGEIFDKTVERTKERFSSMWTWIKTFVVNLAITMGDMMAGAIKGAVNGALSWIESKINSFISMVNSAINLINKIPGVSLSKIPRISLPRLATGGIINQPGRGVPVGGAIAGEAGREGILPLTDRQAMQELGREIGKWITIQNTTPVYIGNRQIARVINEINADREFATNGG